mgnify:FL=1
MAYIKRTLEKSIMTISEDYSCLLLIGPKVLDKGSVPRGSGAILCLREELSAIDRNTFIVPIWMI